MNTFGRIFRISIYGESHQDEVGIVIDGVPPGLNINENDFKVDLQRRKYGEIFTFATTTRKERDIPIIKSGLFNGITTGAPLIISFENKNINSNDYEYLKETPRPSHADFASFIKYKGYNDYRGGGHFSGRLTLPLVAAGIVAKKILYSFYKNIEINAKLIEIGGLKIENYAEVESLLYQTKNKGDTVGGIIECIIKNPPAGLGEPFFDSFESIISHLIFSIPGIKGIEFGAGFNIAKMKGTSANDEIIDISGKTITNNSGGINGGISNGNDILFRVAIKPGSSIVKEQNTINLKTGEKVKIKIQGRHDTCFALRVPVIIEAVTAIAITDFIMINNSFKDFI